jgi:TetR/AcrR family transcriptional regulator
MARPRRSTRSDPGTRDRLLAAAASEFAARGFAGANIDRIAAAAGVTKAMIYYHFTSKADLYRHILADMFGAVEARVREVAASAAAPHDKVRRFVESIAIEAEARPHFPPIWFREIAEGGAHLDARTLRTMSGVVRTLGGIIDEGVRQRQFRPINPLLVHAGVVAPLLLFFASDRLRARLKKAGIPTAGIGHDEVIAHVQRIALGTLEGRLTCE